MLIERLCLALMVALVGDVFLGVFSRYVLQATFRWYDEVARLCFIWIVFLGAAVAVRRGMHFRMLLVVERLGRGAVHLGNRVATISVVAFGGILLAGGYAILPIARRQVTDALEISMLWFYAALPTGGLLMIVFALMQLSRGAGEP